MGKEIWLHSYECAVEDVGEELDCELEKAEEILVERLNADPSYLDGYYAF